MGKAPSSTKLRNRGDNVSCVGNGCHLQAPCPAMKCHRRVLWTAGNPLLCRCWKQPSDASMQWLCHLEYTGQLFENSWSNSRQSSMTGSLRNNWRSSVGQRVTTNARSKSTKSPWARQTPRTRQSDGATILVWPNKAHHRQFAFIVFQIVKQALRHQALDQSGAMMGTTSHRNSSPMQSPTYRLRKTAHEAAPSSSTNSNGALQTESSTARTGPYFSNRRKSNVTRRGRPLPICRSWMIWGHLRKSKWGCHGSENNIENRFRWLHWCWHQGQEDLLRAIRDALSEGEWDALGFRAWDCIGISYVLVMGSPPNWQLGWRAFRREQKSAWVGLVYHWNMLLRLSLASSGVCWKANEGVGRRRRKMFLKVDTERTALH